MDGIKEGLSTMNWGALGLWMVFVFLVSWGLTELANWWGRK